MLKPAERFSGLHGRAINFASFFLRERERAGERAAEATNAGTEGAVRSLRSPRENKEQEGQGGSGFPGPAPCHPLTPTVAPLAHFAQPYGVPYDEAYEPTAKTFCLTAAAQPSTSLVWLLCWMQLARPMEVVQVVRFLS